MVQVKNKRRIREKMKKERSEIAVSRFKEGFSCSQAVLSAFSDLFDLELNLALKISQPFGGGIAHRGEICGAVSGAFMAIGLKYGRTQADDIPARERTYAAVTTFIEKFEGVFGSIICKELLRNDLSTEDGFKKAEDEGLFETLCPKFVRHATELVETLI
jgi:C_GCAxxG_C_C family probable redox protein